MDTPEQAPSKPVRLVLLLQDLRYGGTQTQTVELAKRLAARGFAPEIWVLAGGDDLAPAAVAAGLPIVRLGTRRHVGVLPLLRLTARLRTARPDVLMLLTVVPNIWGRLIGFALRVPVVLGTCRGGASARRQKENWLWPLAHHVVCNSGALARELVDTIHVPEARVSLIPNGLDTDFFTPGPSPKPDHPVILCVARFVPDKDHRTLLFAFQQVLRTRPDAELLLVGGDGSSPAALENLARVIGINDRVRFIARDADIRSRYRAADVFALASRHEALPNAVLEAMACGLPVVATAVGGLPHAVQDGRTGILVPPGAPAAMADALRRLLTDPATSSALGEAGRTCVRERFSFETMAAAHEALIRRLLSLSRPA